MDAEEVVVAKRFVLVDEDGNPRAALMGERDGLLGLHILGEPVREAMISIAVNEQNGSPVVLVRRLTADRRANGAVMLSITEDGRGTVHLEDADGSTRTFTT